MKLIAATTLMAFLAATSAFAADDTQLMEEVKNDMASQGIQIPLPDDVTDDQVIKIREILDDDSRNSEGQAEEIKAVLEQ